MHLTPCVGCPPYRSLMAQEMSETLPPSMLWSRFLHTSDLHCESLLPTRALLHTGWATQPCLRENLGGGVGYIFICLLNWKRNGVFPPISGESAWKQMFWGGDNLYLLGSHEVQNAERRWMAFFSLRFILQRKLWGDVSLCFTPCVPEKGVRYHQDVRVCVWSSHW